MDERRPGEVTATAACRERCSAWKAAWLACIAISFCGATAFVSVQSAYFRK